MLWNGGTSFVNWCSEQDFFASYISDHFVEKSSFQLSALSPHEMDDETKLWSQGTNSCFPGLNSWPGDKFVFLSLPFAAITAKNVNFPSPSSSEIWNAKLRVTFKKDRFSFPDVLCLFAKLNFNFLCLVRRTKTCKELPCPMGASALPQGKLNAFQSEQFGAKSGAHEVFANSFLTLFCSLSCLGLLG